MEYLGIVAGVCTSFSFIPQAIQVIKTKQTKDISLPTYAIYLLGISLWIGYGVYQSDVAIWLTNIVSLCPAIVIFTLKMQEKRRIRN